MRANRRGASASTTPRLFEIALRITFLAQKKPLVALLRPRRGTPQGRPRRSRTLAMRPGRPTTIGGCGACQAPAAVPKLPLRSARKGLAGNIPSNPANRWGPRLRGCTGGVCMYYVPLFREVLYIRYGTPLPLRESASTTIRGYRFPPEHRNSGTRTLSERAAEPRERPGRQ